MSASCKYVINKCTISFIFFLRNMLRQIKSFAKILMYYEYILSLIIDHLLLLSFYNCTTLRLMQGIKFKGKYHTLMFVAFMITVNRITTYVTFSLLGDYIYCITYHTFFVAITCLLNSTNLTM